MEKEQSILRFLKEAEERKMIGTISSQKKAELDQLISNLENKLHDQEQLELLGIIQDKIYEFQNDVKEEYFQFGVLHSSLNFLELSRIKFMSFKMM